MSPLQGPAKPKGVADIIFLIDSSHSMEQLIQGVKDYVISFVEGLDSDQQKSIDHQLAFVCADSKKLEHIDFTTDKALFSRKLGKVKTGWDEVTLPALDFCLDYDWRRGSHKTVILMTDEPVEGGEEYETQVAKLPQLSRKIQMLKAMIYIIGPPCEVFEELGNLPKCMYQQLSGSFQDFDFGSLMRDLGKTVSRSMSIGGQQSASSPPPRDLYDIHSWTEVKRR